MSTEEDQPRNTDHGAVSNNASKKHAPNGNGVNNLGIAGRMTRAFIHSPLSPLLFFAMLAMGLMGLLITPRQEDPQISVPMIDVMVQYPGASSEQVSRLAIEPLERLMSEIPGVRHVYAAAEHGQGIVTIRFYVGEDLGESIVKVRDKIQSNLDKIPPGVMPPLVKPKGVDDVPAVTLTLWSRSVDDGILRTLALDVLQRIKEIKNTGQGFVVGGRAEQIRVQVRPERLSGFNISLDQVANTIRTANSEKRAGSIETGNQYFTVYTGSFLRSAQDIANLVVATRNNVPVYVRDVANVIQAPEEPSQLVSYYTGPEYAGEVKANGEAAVTIAVAKKIGSNGVTVAEDILEMVDSLKSGERPLIPPNVHIEVTRNYGQTANDKVNDLIKKLFIATGAVTFLVWIMLGWRPAIVVMLVIPVVILMTVFSAWLLGFTIDRVSLFALIFSIGILVDDAIVVIENIYRRWLEASTTDTATAIDAVREVGNPTILATFTVIAALLPMGFVSGLMGPYMRPIPALGSVAMLLSLFAAFIFTPWLAMLLKPGLKSLRAQEQKEARDNKRIAALFNKTLVPLLKSHRKAGLFLLSMVVLTALACSMFLFKSVKVKMMPLDNKPEFSVVINMPAGTALPVTANMAAAIAERIRAKIPYVTALQTYAGTAKPFDFNGMVRHYYLRNKPWQAEVQVQLTHKSERAKSSHELAVMAREVVREVTDPFNEQYLAQYPQSKGLRTTIVEMPPGPPVLQSVVAEVYAPDAATRRATARLITRIFENTDGMADVDNYMDDPYPVWRFEVDTEKAVRRGVAVDTINRNLAMALGGYKLGDVKRGRVLEPTYIVLEIPLAARAQVARLGNLPIPTTDGTATLPLAELGRFVEAMEDPVIYHKDLRPMEWVVGDAVGELAAPIYPMLKIQDALKENPAPDAAGSTITSTWIGPPDSINKPAFEWGGEWTVTYETFRDMGAAFAVALILIYILVVWEFGNFVIPAIIMVPIPLTMLGIAPAHALLGAEFTATSMIGFIALAGIIVRNSILLVDFSMHAVREGMPVHEAVVHACRVRTRPILITAGALVMGSFVIITDFIFQGMAITLMAGVLVSTVLTLIVIPLICMYAGRYLAPVRPGQPPTPGSEGPDRGPVVQPPPAPASPSRGLARTVMSTLVMAFYLVRAVFIIIWQGIKSLKGAFAGLMRRSPSAAPAPVMTPDGINSSQISETSATAQSRRSPDVGSVVGERQPVKTAKSPTKVAAKARSRTVVKRRSVKAKQKSTGKKVASPAINKVKARIKASAKPKAKTKRAGSLSAGARRKAPSSGAGVSVAKRASSAMPGATIKPAAGKEQPAKKKPAAKRGKQKRRGIRLNPNI